MKKILFLILVSVSLYGCTKEETKNPTIDPVEEEQKVEPIKQLDENSKLLNKVLTSEQKFIDENSNEVLLKDYQIVEKNTTIDKYVYLDMDNDNIKELVMLTTSDYGAYIVLHIEESKIYGYMVPIRSLEQLKTDGSFKSSSAANYTEYSNMKFNKTTYEIVTSALNDEQNKIYKINGKDVTRSEINTYVTSFDAKEPVEFINNLTN